MTESLELAGMSVGDVFRMLQAPFNIAPTVAALVNGDYVDEEHQLQAGDHLEFARPAGEKGGSG
jgi:sulfur carrier protein ThiS